MARAHICQNCGEPVGPVRMKRRAKRRAQLSKAAMRLMPLTRALREAFVWISAEIRDGGSPSFDSIKVGLGLRSRGGAQHRVNALISLGWLVRRHGTLALPAFAKARQEEELDRANTLSRASQVAA